MICHKFGRNTNVRELTVVIFKAWIFSKGRNYSETYQMPLYDFANKIGMGYANRQVASYLAE